MSHHIKMRIKPDGASCEVSVEGLKGAGCQDVTRDIEAKCGARLSHKHTAEFTSQAEQHIDMNLANE